MENTKKMQSKKMTIGFLLAAAAISLGGMVEARDADLLRAAVAGSVKTLTLGPGACSGCVLPVGDEALPLAFGQVNGVKVPVVAATSCGKGRAVAAAHGSYFEGSLAHNRANAAFLKACLKWLAGGKTPTVVYLDPSNGGLGPAVAAAMKDVQGFQVQPLTSYAALAELPAGTVVVSSPDQHGMNEMPQLKAFLEKGGGVFSTVVGWGWLQIVQRSNPAINLREHNSFNQVMGPFGMYTGDVLVDPMWEGNTFAVTGDGDMPGYCANEAFDLVEGTKSLPNALGARCLFTLGTLATVLPHNDQRYLPRLEKLAKGAGNLVPAPEHTLGVTRVRERLAYQLVQNAWLADPERIWPASPAAASYPGVPEAGSARVTRTVAVDLSIPRWHGTGLFSAAGEPLTVTIPEGFEKLGLRVRVGSTECDITSHQQWSRAPRVVVELPLNKTTTKFSTPFGGMVYIVAPWGQKGKVDVTIGPACAAAWYVEGRDTSDSWVAQLRSSPSPVVELENDHLAITVPKRYVQNLRDPAPLMQLWREIMDNDARLSGLPVKRTSPERFVADVQLCCGYMHAGYPIMIPMGSVPYLMNEKGTRAGTNDNVWGLFHEMGHNHQQDCWTFHNMTEVTVNFFSLYNYEKICGIPPYKTHKLDNERLRQRVKAWEAAGRPMDQFDNDPFLALEFFARLITKYGWGSFEKLFAEYQNCPRSELPQNDMEEREQFCRRLSRIVGEDLSKEFAFMGVKPLPKPAK